jgi:hypothetical protein
MSKVLHTAAHNTNEHYKGLTRAQGGVEIAGWWFYLSHVPISPDKLYVKTGMTYTVRKRSGHLEVIGL